ncbi:hypothetical protein ACRQ5Q_16645 [Bradyrhizobium sp. PMVTL-01]|uniref:hypothetical protein n=1 Tax=Bradyrhizobium sp. PMVTL-01 TaxID=3434999 RepID=UPI003F710A9C
MPASIAVFYDEEIQNAVAAGDDVKTVFRCEDCNGTGTMQLKAAPATPPIEAPASTEAAPTDIALFLAGSLHNVLAHIDTLPLDEYFAAEQAGNKFAAVLEKINGEVSSALSTAGVHSIFERFAETSPLMNRWFHLKARRVLSVDRGKTTVLCDRDIPTELMILVGNAPSEENCPGHVAWSINPKICANCGVHIDSLRPPDEDEQQPEGDR